ncbi:hypothetical protein H0O03_02730 [Candidatus Micrarchaeota archaeon]|nr:hypothetical protein [Candidatus Micrarchaeota archaeon]
MKTFFAALAVLVVLACSASAYSDYSFAVKADVKADGGMHVVEKTVFLFDSDSERTEFESFMNSGENSVLEWRKFSKNIRYHFGGSLVESESVKISARREYTVSFSAGSVTLEYDVSPDIFVKEKTSSRVMQYSLDSSYLSFDISRNREPVLGSGARLEMTLPADATAVEIAPIPDAREGNTFSWTGPVIGAWKVVFEREQPLSDEVNEFFASLSQNVFALIPFILVLGLIAFVAVKLMKSKSS